MEQAMELLPTANTEITQFFRQWLETFAGYVREVGLRLGKAAVPPGRACLRDVQRRHLWH